MPIVRVVAATPALEPQPAISIKIVDHPGISRCFHGFCPVALRNERRLELAQSHLFSDVNGVRYEFATPQAKVLFDRSPQTYLPVANGHDIVALHDTGNPEMATLTHAHWYRGRLFLFTTAENAHQFALNPRKYYP